MSKQIKYTDSQGIERFIEQFAIISIDESGDEVVSGSGVPSVPVIVEGTLTGTISNNSKDGQDGTKDYFEFNPPIKGMIVSANHGNDSTITTREDNALLLCVDPPTEPVADAWLDEANVAPRVKIKPADGVQAIYFNGSLVSRVYFKTVGASPDLNISIGGVS